MEGDGLPHRTGPGPVCLFFFVSPWCVASSLSGLGRGDRAAPPWQQGAGRLRGIALDGDGIRSCKGNAMIQSVRCAAILQTHTTSSAGAITNPSTT